MTIKTDSLKLNNVSATQIHAPLKIFSAFKQNLTGPSQNNRQLVSLKILI
jgi:hypothetical protein